MLKDEWERYKSSGGAPANPMIGWDEVPDGLLVYGYTLERATFVVWCEGEMIYRCILPSGTPEEDIIIEGSPRWEAEQLRPSKRAFPETTNAEFAESMRGRGVDLYFTTWTDITPEQVEHRWERINQLRTLQRSREWFNA